jgi:uncharacterized membrane protein
MVLFLLATAHAAEEDPILLKERTLNSSISTTSLSPNGNHIAVGFFDGFINGFDRNLDLKWINLSAGPVRSVSISKEGENIIAATGSELVFLKRGDIKWRKSIGFVKDVSISDNGMFFAATTPTGVKYGDELGNIIKTFTTLSPPESVALSGDGKILAVGDQNSIHLINHRKGLLWSVNLFERVDEVEISPEGRYIITSAKGIIHLISNDGTLLWTSDFGLQVKNVAIGPEGGFVAIGTANGVQLLDREGEILWTWRDGSIQGVAISTSGDRFSFSSDKTIYLFYIPKIVPPRVSITSPIDGDEVSGAISISTEKSRFSSVTIYINENEISRSPNLKFDTRLLKDGEHTISAVARNFLGEIYSETVKIVVKNEVDPSPIKIFNIKEGSILSRSVMIFVISNLPFEDISLYLNDEELSKNIPFQLNTRDFKNGVYEIKVVAKRFGEIYEDSVTVFIDNSPLGVKPFVKIFSPLPEEEIKGQKAVRAVFSETPTEVYVSINNIIVSDSLPFIWDTDAEKPGNIKLSVLAFDKSGNLIKDSINVIKLMSSDTDNDGWSDEKEKLHQTDPENPDTDDDGIPDSLDEDPHRDQRPLQNYLLTVLILMGLSTLLIKDTDLRIVLALSLLASIFIAVKPLNKTFLRVPLGLFTIFFATGYPFISSLFPNKVISMIERLTLSVGSSIVIFILNGFALNNTLGFRTTPIVITLSIIILVFSLTAAILRSRYTGNEGFKLGFPKISRRQYSVASFNHVEKVLLFVLVISIFLSGTILIYTKLNFQEERFTEFYLLGKGGNAEGYTKGSYLGDPQSYTFGIENYESEPVNYTFNIKLSDRILKEESFLIEPRETFIKTDSFVPYQVGNKLKLEFLLYKEGESEQYRSNRLWIYSIPNFANPNSYERYIVGEIPKIENGDFELGDMGWTFNASNLNFTGFYGNQSFVSPPFAYGISLPWGKTVVRRDYAVLSQEVPSEEGIAILSFTVHDTYSINTAGRYRKEASVNGVKVWEQDAAGREGWERIVVPINIINGANKIQFKLSQSSKESRPITLFIDDVKIEPIDSLIVI